MQNVVWPIVAKVAPFVLTVAAHSRGDTGRGGQSLFERGPGAQFKTTLQVVPMLAADALKFRAFLHGLRGRSGSFLLSVENTTTGAAVGTITAAAAADADSVTIDAGLAASSLVKVGAFLLIGMETGTCQLLRVVSKSGTTLGIRPRLRAQYGSGSPVTAGRVVGKFRLNQDTPQVPLTGQRSATVSLDIIEAY
jgi:hypothetical protein